MLVSLGIIQICSHGNKQSNLLLLVSNENTRVLFLLYLFGVFLFNCQNKHFYNGSSLCGLVYAALLVSRQDYMIKMFWLHQIIEELSIMVKGESF